MNPKDDKKDLKKNEFTLRGFMSIFQGKQQQQKKTEDVKKK